MPDPHEPTRPMRLKLSEERRERILCSIKELFSERFDEELSDFRAALLVDFFIRELGPPVYNQAIQDARSFIQDKLTDLEGDFYEPEPPFSR